MSEEIYIVTKDTDSMGRCKNICVTEDPDEARGNPNELSNK